jgi:hypothetical protein
MAGLPLVWGATQTERDREYPADLIVPEAMLLTRAIDVIAPADVTWRWLCQIAVSSYSYDWIDNCGRQSPRQLTPGAERLRVGQELAGVFVVVEIEPGRSFTMVTDARGDQMFGQVAVTYAAEPDGPDESRIVCRLACDGRGRLRQARVSLLAWADLVMMRKQLLTLRDLAERDSKAAVFAAANVGRGSGAARR